MIFVVWSYSLIYVMNLGYKQVDWSRGINRIRDTRTNKRQKRHVEKRYITRRNSKFENHKHFERDDFFDHRAIRKPTGFSPWVVHMYSTV